MPRKIPAERFTDLVRAATGVFIAHGYRRAQMEDVAKALVFLGSDASVFVNGVNLNADLGFSAALTTGQLDFSTLPR